MIICVCLFVPYFHNILYSVPTADDFSMIVGGKPCSGIMDDLLFAVKSANSRYMTWGGGMAVLFPTSVFESNSSIWI